MNKSETLEKLRRLKIAFEAGEIPVLHNHEKYPDIDRDSREIYLYFILTCSLNFQRSSPKTWESAINTWDDPETNFVFFPERVIETDIEVLRSALLKHRLALQPNKHIEIWRRLSATFHDLFESDPRKLFERGEYDATKVLQIVQIELKKEFPYLSGLKLSNYFLFILLLFTELKLKNTHMISIIPDTHIMKATEVLGILSGENINPKNVEVAWRELLEGSEFSPIDFHSILWNWSRNRFEPMI